MNGLLNNLELEMNMKSNNWYLIEFELGLVKEFENYLLIIKKSIKYTRVEFSVYKMINPETLTRIYYINEEESYIYDFIVNKYKQIEKCKRPHNLGLSIKIV